jgi:hypothetical protein
VDAAAQAKVGIEVADHAQSMWEHNWQSATAAILLVVWLLTLFLLFRSQHKRVTDIRELEKEHDAFMRAERDRHDAKLEALAGRHITMTEAHSQSYRALVRAIEDALPKRQGRAPRLPEEPLSNPALPAATQEAK